MTQSMRVLTTGVITTVLITSGLLLADMAWAAPPGETGPADQAIAEEDTVLVDCASGDSINAAMNSSAKQLIIDISGVCVEDVWISRNKVIFRGASGDATIDGVQKDPAGPRRNPVEIVGFNTISFENLHFTGGFAGITMNASFGINIVDCLIFDNEFTGVLAGSASGSINIITSTITADPANPYGYRLSRGIWAANGSNMRCIGCTIENYRTGAMATAGSEIGISSFDPFGSPVQSNVSGTRTAVGLFSGGKLHSTDAALAGYGTGFSFLRGGIWADAVSSAQVYRGSILGRLEVQQNSTILLDGVSHDDNGYSSRFIGNSTATVRGNSSLTGSVDLSEFSNLTLHDGSTVTGVLECSRGADAFCDTPADVLGGAATCGQCQ